MLSFLRGHIHYMGRSIAAGGFELSKHINVSSALSGVHPRAPWVSHFSTVIVFPRLSQWAFARFNASCLTSDQLGNWPPISELTVYLFWPTGMTSLTDSQPVVEKMSPITEKSHRFRLITSFPSAESPSSVAIGFTARAPVSQSLVYEYFQQPIVQPFPRPRVGH